MPPYIDKERCSGCGTCFQHCPLQVFQFDSTLCRPYVAFPRECWHCNCCVLDCREKAIKLLVPLSCSLLYIDAERLKASASGDKP